MKIKLLFLLLFISTMVYSQSLFKDKNGILSPTANRSIGVPSLYNFAIGDTSVLRLRSGVTQFYNNGTWYSIPIPANIDSLNWNTAYSLSHSHANKSKLDSLSFNASTINGITSTLISNWNTAFTNNHTHANKSKLDSLLVAASFLNSITGNLGSNAYTSTAYVPQTTTVNGHALSANVSVTAADVGLGNVTNESKATMFTNPIFTLAQTTKSTSYTATSSDYAIYCIGGSSGITITLPAAVSNSGRIYVIKKIDSGVGKITIDGNASETIDGALTWLLTLQYESVTIQCDGSNWYIN